MEAITSFFVLVGIHQHETASGERVLRRNTDPTLKLRGELRSTPVEAPSPPPQPSPLLKLITKAQPQGSYILSSNHLCTYQVNWSLPYTEKNNPDTVRSTVVVALGIFDYMTGT